MTTARGNAACVRLQDGRILGIGGSDDLNALRSVECLDYPTKGARWQFLNLMNYRRNHPYAVIFKRKVFVVGGSNEPGNILPRRSNGSYVNSMEMLTPPLPEDRLGSGQWTVLNNMPDINRIVSLAACQDGIVAFGESRYRSVTA